MTNDVSFSGICSINKLVKYFVFDGALTVISYK